MVTQTQPKWDQQAIHFPHSSFSFTHKSTAKIIAQTKMSVFDQLRPFVSFCQACGMIPFTIEQNQITNKFAKFTFSFRHLTTWWFFLVMFMETVVMSVMGYVSFIQTFYILNGQNLPITVIILLFVIGMSYFAQLLLSRWIILHYRQLRNAIETIQEVEKLFGEKFISQHKSSVTTRFIIGFVLVVISAIGTLTLSTPIHRQFSSLIYTNNVFASVATFSTLAFIYLLFESTFFFFHMCYYIIAYYVQLLIIRSDAEDQTISQKKKENMGVLKENTLILNYLCRASQELNRIFSFPVLILLTAKFISVVTTAFAYIYNCFIHSNVVLDSYSWLFLFTFFTDWIKMLILFNAADMPVNQVIRLLRDKVTAISSYGLSHSLAEKFAFMTSLVQIDENRVRLSAAGLFKVGMHLVPALAGAVVTYMVILLQN
ncbi:hypothetical protein DAPPUDRAFT_346876 [Daphnia pulex]|uniref:Gustatory receptor n=1 Tax=Daphnia pulex TaxID=6669 RepID=E9HPP7_DAPPU|nr:hypothetical protein DAPPUDRAFT_346876 [Daphnia pulex]|eukprot:EFX66301.1 hypothetical protein DAPPUDRAFT_346876 [Daphnia pulex]